MHNYTVIIVMSTILKNNVYFQFNFFYRQWNWANESSWADSTHYSVFNLESYKLMTFLLAVNLSTLAMCVLLKLKLWYNHRAMLYVQHLAQFLPSSRHMNTTKEEMKFCTCTYLSLCVVLSFTSSVTKHLFVIFTGAMASYIRWVEI